MRSTHALPRPITMDTGNWSVVSSVHLGGAIFTMFFVKSSLLREVVFLVLLVQLLALIGMSSGSWVDSGCSEGLKRVSVRIAGKDIECDHEYKLSSVDSTTQPEFSFSGAEQDDLYVLTMIDPDAPSNDNPKFRSWLHFMAVNIKGKDLAAGNISPSNVVMEYNPPGPPKGSGLHRYITFALRQGGTLSGVSFQARKSFDIDKFVKDKGLIPEGSNMFKTERT